MRRQSGKFYLPVDFVETSPLEAMEIFKHCSIVGAHLLWDAQKYEYTALSSQFEVLPEGVRAPFYKWEKRNGQYWAKLESA